MFFRWRARVPAIRGEHRWGTCIRNWLKWVPGRRSNTRINGDRNNWGRRPNILVNGNRDNWSGTSWTWGNESDISTDEEESRFFLQTSTQQKAHDGWWHGRILWWVGRRLWWRWGGRWSWQLGWRLRRRRRRIWWSGSIFWQRITSHCQRDTKVGPEEHFEGYQKGISWFPSIGQRWE